MSNIVGCGCTCCWLLDLSEGELVEAEVKKERDRVANTYPLNSLQAHLLMHMFSSQDCCFEH